VGLPILQLLLLPLLVSRHPSTFISGNQFFVRARTEAASASLDLLSSDIVIRFDLPLPTSHSFLCLMQISFLLHNKTVARESGKLFVGCFGKRERTRNKVSSNGFDRQIQTDLAFENFGMNLSSSSPIFKISKQEFSPLSTQSQASTTSFCFESNIPQPRAEECLLSPPYPGFCHLSLFSNSFEQIFCSNRQLSQIPKS
jgi:hypothetical protein